MGEVDGVVLGLVLAVVAATALWPRSRGGTGVTGSRATGAEGAGETHGVLARARELLRREVRLGRCRPEWVADFAELSAVGLEAGLPAVEAARLACSVGAGSGSGTRTEPGAGVRAGSGGLARASTGVVAGASTGATDSGRAELARRLDEAQATGRPVGEALALVAHSDRDLGFLAAAWQLTDEFGVAAAPAARASADVLRERRAGHDRRAVLAAGPRASMWLLTLLPVAGPAVTLVLGLPVRSVYGGPVALAAVVGGLILTALGWWWSRTILRRAMCATGLD